MAWNKAAVTKKGLELLAKSIRAGGVEITSAQGGEGFSLPDTVESLLELTAVQGKNHSLLIAKKETEQGNIIINVRMENIGVKASFNIRQIGLFGKVKGSSESPVLFAVIQDQTGEVIPTEAENPEFLLEFDFVIPISNGENIQISMNPNVFAKLTEVNQKESTLKAEIAAVNNALNTDKSNLSAHISDNVKHITAAERTDWNGKAAANHTHTYIKELVPTKNENNEVDLNKLIVGNSVGFWKIDSRQYTVLNAPTASATQGLLVAVDFENGGFGEQYFSPYSSNTRYFRSYYYGNSKVVFGSWYKIFDGANAAAALKLANARKINGVGFDGTADITITAAANGGNAQTVNGHTVLSDVPANAKYTDTTYSAATATADGLMSKEDKAKLDNTSANLSAHTSDNVKHITAAERTDWSGKAAANHTHTYIKELVPTKNENNEVDLNKLIVGNSVGFWKIDSRQYTVLNAPTASATQGLLVAVDFENGGFGEQYFSPYSSNTRYFRSYYYGNSKVVFGSWYKIFDGANAAAALKLANARKINGVGFDGTADITITAAANGGNAQTVNGHTVLSDVPANAKYTDTTYSAATATADGLMSKEDKKKLDTYPATFSTVKGEKGDKGDMGATGARGSIWHTGTNVTGSSYTADLVGIEEVNDMYLNTSTGEIFQCTEVSNQAKWVRKCTLNLIAKG